jgi:hypothetical protein
LSFHKPEWRRLLNDEAKQYNENTQIKPKPKQQLKHDQR